jgi:hypothetical protein
MMAELHKPIRVTLHCDVVVYDWSEWLHAFDGETTGTKLFKNSFVLVRYYSQAYSFLSFSLHRIFYVSSSFLSLFYFPHFSLIGKLILPKLTPVFKLQRFISAQPFLIEGILQVRSWTQPVFS